MRPEHGHDSADDRGWPMRNRTRSDAEHVGVVNRDTSVFYFPERAEFARFTADDENEEWVEDDSFVQSAEESLADAIERVGDETGIDRLSEWAGDHLESDDSQQQ